jgi:TetR/AcrR family transcriptional regulator, transcriptional repressor for nem operon
MARRSRKSHLLDSASTLVARQGYAGTTVDALCESSGLSKGAFFHHFPDRESFGLALLAHFEDSAAHRLAELTPPARGDARAHLDAYLDALEQMYGHDVRYREGCLFAIFNHESADAGSALRTACAAALERWMSGAREHFRYVIDALGHPVAVTPDELAEHLLVVIEGALVMGRLKGPERAVRHALAQFRRYARSVLSEPGA